MNYLFLTFIIIKEVDFMEEIFDPLKKYNLEIKEKYRQTAEKMFDDLAKEAKVDIEANRKTVAAYNDSLLQAQKQNGVVSRFKVLRGFLIFLIIVLFGTAIVGVILCTNQNFNLVIGLSMAIGGVVLGVLFLVLILKVVNKKIKNNKEILEAIQEEANKYLDEASSQMGNLNALFDWSVPSKICEKSTPLIKLDPIFDNEKYGYLYEKYGFAHSEENNKSIVGVQSGSVLGNPFLLYRTYNQKIDMKLYTGSLVISYRTTEVDASGHRRTYTKTQTLTARIEKPAPSYYYDTELVYGNGAAPNLSFSRKPSGATGLSDNQVSKMVKKGSKKLQKKMCDDLMDNDETTNFTAMTNDKFDVLFGAIDRTNETEFRLLFTPLAQNSMINLIENAKPYGDDFYFVKENCLNYISSIHSQTEDYFIEPSKYSSYSYDESRNKFIEYNCHFLEALYFDLAPLLCIPLYQQYKPVEYIYDDIFHSNYNAFESETIANTMDGNIFKPEDAITEQILKARETKRAGKTDIVNIVSYAFTGIKHVEYVPTLGGDGKFHDVPVEWIEYKPVEKATEIAVKDIKVSRKTYFSEYTSNTKVKEFLESHSLKTVFRNGVIGMALIGSYIDKDDILFDSFFEKGHN